MDKKLPKKLRVMADYHSSGIWVIEPMLGFRHGMISHEDLGLLANLSNKFKKWIETYNARLNNQDFDIKEFDHKGLELAKELKSFVGPSIYVEYEPEESDYGTRMTEVINREISKVNIFYRIYLRIVDFIRWQLVKFTGDINLIPSRYHEAMDKIQHKPEVLKELELLRQECRKTVVIE